MSEQSTPQEDNIQEQSSAEWEQIETIQNYLAKALRQHDGGRQIEADAVLCKFWNSVSRNLIITWAAQPL